MEKIIQGVAASPGIAIGTILKLPDVAAPPPRHRIAPAQAEAEKKRYTDAVAHCADQVRALAEASADSESADILLTHLAILQDPMLLQRTSAYIDRLENAEHALVLAAGEIADEMLAVEDELLRARVADLDDEVTRLRQHLRGEAAFDLSRLPGPVVLLARDLSPSQTATLDTQNVLGFATDLGGGTSHTAILARAMQVPAVVGAGALYDKAENGQHAVVDGFTGAVTLNPAPPALEDARARQREHHRKLEVLRALRPLPAQTTNGTTAQLLANLGSLAEVAPALDNGAEGVGMLRTEFMYMEARAFPGEEVQTGTYRQLVRQMAGRPVTIRTLDIGGDKALPYHRMAAESNPYLGLRAVRFSLLRPDIFKTQLRAILRASAHGKTRLLIPMVVSAEEIDACRALLEDCKAQLRADGHPFDDAIELGIMVETPAAVALADLLAPKVDFFNIGTNDLTQYVLAVDRGNTRVQHLYDSLHPAVLHSLDHVLKAAARHGRPACLCGALAGDARAAPLLLGLGLRHFSMPPAAIPQVKQAVRAVGLPAARQLAAHCLGLSTTHAVHQAINTFWSGIPLQP